MKKFRIIFTILLIAIFTIMICGCNTNGNGVNNSNGNQTTVNRPQYIEDTLSLAKYKNYLLITSTYTSKTNSLNKFMKDVTFNVTITPRDNNLIFENCTIKIEGKTFAIQSTGTTNFQFTTTKSSFDDSFGTLREPSGISGKVKRPNDGTYRVYYLDMDDNVIKTESIKQGQSLNNKFVPTSIKGYNFVAWSFNSHDGHESTYLQYPYTPSKDVWLYCVVKKVEISVTLISDDGVTVVNIEYGSAYKLLTPTLKDDLEFVGWFDTISGKGTQYTDSNGNSINICEFAGPITLYARWQVKKTDKEWDDKYYYSIEYYNIKNAKASYYSPNYFFIDAEPNTTYKVTTSTNYLNMNTYVSIRIAGAMGALLEGGSFINYSFGTNLYSCPTFTFEVSKSGRYFIAVIGHGLQSTPNLDYVYNISCQIVY